MLKVACSGPSVSRTRNLSVTSPILYHYTTAKLVPGAVTTESLVRCHLGCPYTNKNVCSIDGIHQAQCQAVAVPAASCSRSVDWQRGNSGHQNGCGSSGRCVCQRRLNADGGETCQRSQDAIVSKVRRRQAVQRLIN